MSKLRVNVKILEKHIDYINNINSKDLIDIDFYYNRKKMKIDSKYIKEWKFIGLNNVDFIRSIIGF